MKPIAIGKNAAGEPIYITPEMRKSTHSHIIGGSGTGKSKFLEWMIQKDLREGHGLCVIDWHGTLYQDLLTYCAHLDIGLDNDFRSLILLNPSDPQFITGFNPFMNEGRDVSVQVSNRVDTIRKVWGMNDPNQAPTFERVCRTVFTFAVEHRQTLPIASLLLDYDKPELRKYASQMLMDTTAKGVVREWQMIKTLHDWQVETLSTDNRFNRFVGSLSMRRFLGLVERNINLREIMDEQKILLINLGSSDNLDQDSARAFAAMFLREFFDTAMRRAQEARRLGREPETFVLYLDEFQEYITEDIAAMLDQVRKGGLHLVLAHQHLSHLQKQPTLLDSVLTNARIRAVFGGLPYESAVLLANEMFLPDLNTRQIKKAYYHTIHLYQKEIETAKSRSHTRGTAIGENWSSGGGSGSIVGSGQSQSASLSAGTSASKSLPGSDVTIFTPFTEGWFTEGQSSNRTSSQGASNFSSKSHSDFQSSGGSRTENESESIGETEFPVWVPIPVQELTTESEWSLEEKRSKVAEMLKCQQQRHCFIKLETETTQPLNIPFVRPYFHSLEYLLEYEQKIYSEQGALPAADVDRILIEHEQHFLSEVERSIDNTLTLLAPKVETKRILGNKAKPRITRKSNE
jgi:hypothetical protein